MSIPDIKSKNDKVSETVTLLKQILGLGIHENDVSYLEVKSYCKQWIESEERKIFEYKILFTRYDRMATLTLPWRSDRSCEFRMPPSPFVKHSRNG